jgi:phosphatidylinositol alpha 1,6-mannosyltransferase
MSVPRVAFFSDSFYEVNGVALTSREFVGFAVRSRHPFLAVHVGPETKYWLDDTLESLELAHSRFTLRLERDLSFDLLFYRHCGRIRSALMEFRPDVIHVTGPSHIGMLGAILAYDLKVPLVASWHTNIHDFAAQRLAPKLRWLGESRSQAIAEFAKQQSLRWTLRFYQLAKVLYAPNPELVAMLGEQTGRPAYLMQRGIDTRLFSPERRTRTDRDFVIGFVGRLSPEKNVRMLASLEASLVEAGVRDCRFFIVGDGSERPWLMQNMRRAELPGVLSGEELATAYANMDAFVFPSQTDTFGNVVLEAMASGVPVVVSNNGGPKFLVESQKNGYVAENFTTFVEAIMDLRSHPSLRERLSEGARASALKRSWDSVFENVYLHYEEALMRKTGHVQHVSGPLVRVP